MAARHGRYQDAGNHPHAPPAPHRLAALNPAARDSRQGGERKGSRPRLTRARLEDRHQLLPALVRHIISLGYARLQQRCIHGINVSLGWRGLLLGFGMRARRNTLN